MNTSPTSNKNGTCIQSTRLIRQTYSATAEKAPLAAATNSQREPADSDVMIKILYCSVGHSDLHFARNEWGFTSDPTLPDHEIIGRVTAIGRIVMKLQVGDTVGVDCALPHRLGAPAGLG